MKITLDEDKCIGGGQCVMVAPEIFDQRDEDGIGVILDAEPPADQHHAVRQAALVCPAAAIQIQDAD
ncbi:ferredoxin [Nonomuraea typhae]|uniref:Ferredoxin n=1 Tax=Nonomuraea typhae TaxID=2603600 RepID=A0ABW7YXD9_9ACTN